MKRLLAVSEGLASADSLFSDAPLRAKAAGMHDAVATPDRAGTPVPDAYKDVLTAREGEIVGQLLSGYRVSTIAHGFQIRPNTVRRHLKSIFLKLGVSSQAELLEKLKPWQVHD